MSDAKNQPRATGVRVAALARAAISALRRRAPTPLAVDVGFAGAFLLAMIVERVGAAAAIGARMPLALALSVLIAAGLLLRRRAPLTGFLLGSAALSAEALIVAPSPVSPYANLIGVYCVGVYAARRRAWWGPVLVAPGAIAYFAGIGSSGFAAPAGVVFSWTLAWALGYSTARRREEQQTSLRLLRQQAITEERTRIARELHDLIGHTVNLMLVQAGAARRTLDRDPGQARIMLSNVESTGRDALAELDRALGMLRLDGRAEPDSADEPGLTNLPGLVEQMALVGIRVTVELDLDGSQVPRSLSLTAYRIIQEALTNALKHGQAGRATVVVRHAGHAVTVEVSDDGRGPDPGYSAGRGLLGIGERVALFGGGMEHGGGERGGFWLRAELPMP